MYLTFDKNGSDCAEEEVALAVGLLSYIILGLWRNKRHLRKTDSGTDQQLPTVKSRIGSLIHGNTHQWGSISNLHLSL